MAGYYNIYCDESGHLEKDQVPVMVLGAVWCPIQKTREIATRIREIKEKHGVSRDFEIKWTKVSPGKIDLYLAVLEYFFNEDDLHFRALVARDKSKLNHAKFDQTHDDWYYKMYYQLLGRIISPPSKYRIYLDIKDTKSLEKVTKLEDVLCSSKYDFSREVIERLQTVRSHEIEQIQLADLLIGAVSYANRGLTTSSAKLKFVEKVREQSGFSLIKKTSPSEMKFNVFIWDAAER